MDHINILIVDDAPFIREILKKILLKAGHNVVGEAEDGNEAIRLALETNPDIILMDIVMPIKSGIEATKEILERQPGAKIIMLSTIDQEHMIHRSMEAGALDFVQKPFENQKLLDVIRKNHQARGPK